LLAYLTSTVEPGELRDANVGNVLKVLSHWGVGAREVLGKKSG